jgi:hypothetical protein
MPAEQPLFPKKIARGYPGDFFSLWINGDRLVFPAPEPSSPDSATKTKAKAP